MYSYSRLSTPGDRTIQPPRRPLITREHILRECPIHEDYRYLLRKASPVLSTQAILGTRKGIIALTQFLKESGAFTRTGKDILPRSLPEFIDEPLPQIDVDDEDEEPG